MEGHGQIFFFYLWITQMWRLLHISPESNWKKSFFSWWVADIDDAMGIWDSQRVSAFWRQIRLSDVLTTVLLLDLRSSGHVVGEHRWPCTWPGRCYPMITHDIFGDAAQCESRIILHKQWRMAGKVPWFHESLHRHEPLHMVKAGVRPLAEKGIGTSQEHGEGRGESQKRSKFSFMRAFHWLPIVLYLPTDELLSFCPLHPHREGFSLSWGNGGRLQWGGKIWGWLWVGEEKIATSE